MPCTITGTLEGDARLAMEEALLDKSKLVKKYRKDKLKLTQMLCAAMKAINEYEVGSDYPPLVPDENWVWWQQHDKQDQKGKQAKKKKKGAR